MLGAASNLRAEDIGWLTIPQVAESLADRVEDKVLAALRSTDGITAVEIDTRLCKQLPGLLTPDRRLLMATLRSYAQQDLEDRLWRLRPEDQPEARQADVEEILRLLKSLGVQLGYEVSGTDAIEWRDQSDQSSLLFRVDETAKLGSVMRGHARSSAEIEAIVIPGGRGALVAEKARRDLRLQAWLESGLHIIKYRHVRRLSEDTTAESRGISSNALLWTRPVRKIPSCRCFEDCSERWCCGSGWDRRLCRGGRGCRRRCGGWSRSRRR